jgi:hypothetical protein
VEFYPFGCQYGRHPLFRSLQSHEGLLAETLQLLVLSGFRLQLGQLPVDQRSPNAMGYAERNAVGRACHNRGKVAEKYRLDSKKETAMVARGILCAVAVALLGLCASVALGAQPGLVAHYRLDEGEGTIAKDGSGQGHDGTIHGAGYVRHGDGFALCLDGEDDYVEIAPTADFAGRNEGAFELWFRPRAWQGGLIDWSASGFWEGIRLTLAFNTYHRQEQDAIFLANLADGAGSRHGQLPRPAKNTWTHLAVSFRGGQATIYGDGRSSRVRPGWGRTESSRSRSRRSRTART